MQMRFPRDVAALDAMSPEEVSRMLKLKMDALRDDVAAGQVVGCISEEAWSVSKRHHAASRAGG